MIKEIIHDTIFLAQKSDAATAEDINTVQDLVDTLSHNKDVCIGMAANMIGVKKRIICFEYNGAYMAMLNPEIIKCSDCFQTEEGCLSLLGGPRKTKRYKKIKVRYQTIDFKTVIKSFEGLPAQIIQHEIDHCNGVLI